MSDKKQAENQQPKEKAVKAFLYRNTSTLTQRLKHKDDTYRSIPPNGLASLEEYPTVDRCPAFIPVRTRQTKEEKKG